MFIAARSSPGYFGCSERIGCRNKDLSGKMSNVFKMRPALLIGLLAALYPLSAAHADPRADIAQEIGQLEDAYSQSFVTGDAKVAERLLAADFVGFDPSGKTWDKATMLADVRSEPHQTSAKITALTVRQYGDTAIALGTEEDTNAGATAVAHRRWLDTWKRTPNGWRLVASAEITPQP
jgi:hypothetical protein